MRLPSSSPSLGRGFLSLILLIAMVVCIGNCNAQAPPNNPILTGSSSYNGYDWTGVLTIQTGANIVLNNPVWQYGATLVVQQGGTLTLNATTIQAAGPLQIYGSVTVKGDLIISSGGLDVEAGGILLTDQLDLNGINSFTGNTKVSLLTEIHNGSNIFSNCGTLTTGDLFNDNDNTVDGNGGIHITGNYNNQASMPGYQGHPLSTSNQIYVWYVPNGLSTSGSFGSAVQSSTNNSPCAADLPVRFLSFTLKGNYHQ